MAKIGEGDPRWLVENREDGRNVNNWHWTEKNLTPWVKEKLQVMFDNRLIFEDETYKIISENMESLKGDVSVNNRKGRNKFIWDISINLRWRGDLKGKDESGFSAKGKIECTDITTVDSTFEVNVTADDNTNAESRKMCELAKIHGMNLVNECWNSILEEMKENHRDNVPQKTSSSFKDESSAIKSFTDKPRTSGNDNSNSVNDGSEKKSDIAVNSVKTKNGQIIKVRDFNQKYWFRIPANVLFDTLLDPDRVSAFTGSQSIISRSVGSEFKIFGGNVLGVIEEIKDGQRIVQSWRFASWPANHYSKVIFDFKPDDTSCYLEITQTGIPENDYERTSSGWESHYCSRIRGFFCWEYTLLD